MRFRIKENVGIAHDIPAWISAGGEYEGHWAEEFPPKSPPDVWLVNPNDEKQRYRVPLSVLDRLDE